MDLQALRYPAMISAMAFEQVVDAHEAYLAKGDYAAVGDPVVDRARTWTILTLDPATRAGGAKPAWQAPLEGWAKPRACTTSPPPYARGHVNS